MARPITWQDVAAPRGGALAAEATIRAGKAIQEAVTGFGQIAGDARTAIQKSATDAALAGIVNSNDPLAAAAAVPTDNWRFDPLAIAGAANARNDQLQKSKLADAQLRASNLAADVSQAQLEDNVAAREASDLALQYYDAASTGKSLNIDRTDPMWKTKAGTLALDRIDGWARDYRDQKYKEDSLALQRAQAKAAMDDRAEAKALEAANSEITGVAASKAGAGMDPKGLDRMILDVYAKHGVKNGNLALGRQAWELGLSGNSPVDVELDAELPDGSGLTYRDVQNSLIAEGQARTLQQTAEIGKFEQLNNISANLAKSDYEGLTEAAAARKLSETYGWDNKDAMDRLALAQSEAPKGVTLTVAQRAEIAALTSGSFLGGIKDNWSLVGNDAARARLDEYSALQREGGAQVVSTKLANLLAQQEATNARTARRQQEFNYTVRNQENLPADIAKAHREKMAADRKALEKRQKEAEAASNAAAQELAYQERLTRGGQDFARRLNTGKERY